MQTLILNRIYRYAFRRYKINQFELNLLFFVGFGFKYQKHLIDYFNKLYKADRYIIKNRSNLETLGYITVIKTKEGIMFELTEAGQTLFNELVIMWEKKQIGAGLTPEQFFIDSSENFQEN